MLHQVTTKKNRGRSTSNPSPPTSHHSPSPPFSLQQKPSFLLPFPLCPLSENTHMPKIPEQLSRESLERERRRRKMREEVEHNWFVRWEEELPRPEDLMPLSQSLITHDLALAFDISAPNPNTASVNDHLTPLLPPPAAEFDSVDLSASADAASGGDESVRTLKRPRLVWTPQLHKRFVDAVAHLGIRNAVPKTIMQLMSVDGLTRENVASHLQKYRLYLKRMQELSSSAASAPGSGGLSSPISAADAATEQLFASNPIPHHFLGRGIAGHGQEPFMQLMASPLVQHHQQMMAASTAAQQLYFHQRQMEHFGSTTAANGGYIHGFLASDAAHSPGLHGMEAAALDMMQPPMEAPPPNSNVGDLDSGSGGRGRRALTLFPTGCEN